MQTRQSRRHLGVLCKRLPEVGFDQVEDPRHRRGRRWSLPLLLSAVVVGIVAGCRSLAHLEALSAESSPAAGRLLGWMRRIPDTTLRNILVRLHPDELRRCLHRQIRRAHRRKALAPQGLPFGVVSLDGKYTPVRDDNPLSRFTVLRPRKDGSGHNAYVCSVTACLVSSRQRVCIDTTVLPPGYGEQTHYDEALYQLRDAYASLPDLFKLVTYDAGGCSYANARSTVEEFGLHYFMRLKAGQQRRLTAEAEHRLAARAVEHCDASTAERYKGRREVRCIFLAEGVDSWKPKAGARTLVRLLHLIYDADGVLRSSDNRYWVSSLPVSQLTPEQWLLVARRHWGVENNCHHTFDAVLREDERPWIVAEGRAAFSVMILRRIAYNILTLHRCAYHTAERASLPRWRDLMRRTYNALIASRQEQLVGLKPPDFGALRAPAT